MSFTNCCNHRFIGDNHSPIQPDGYCLHCGFHPEIEELRKDLLYFWTWIVGGYESRPETGLRNELDIMGEKYPWLETRSCQAIDQELEKQLEEVK